MVQGFELTGLAGTLALVVPLLVLLGVVFLGSRSCRGPKRKSSDADLAKAEKDRQAARELDERRQHELRRKRDARARADQLARDIALAERKGPETTLPGLYLEAGRNLLVLGDGVAAGDRLRMSLIASAKHGMKLEHAQARIELGDLSADQGDLTTACEHWSIARSMVHELKRSTDISAVEARIRDHGCPTDWVLNDF